MDKISNFKSYDLFDWKVCDQSFLAKKRVGAGGIQQDGEVIELHSQELNEIFGVRSNENERIKFGRPVKVRAQGIE